MISCIVCSRYSALSERLVQNIQHTIGESFELVVLDNSKNKYSMFSAYNEGVRRAKGEFLCFMHEDILFHSDNWGKEIVNIFADSSVGLIGVLGTQFLPSTPSAWWWSGCTVGHVLQSKNNKLGCGNWSVNGNPIVKDTDAVAVDGLWFCVKRELFDRISYDEASFNSFHCYDLDICMQVLSLGKRIIVAHGIIIEHASEGDVGKVFLNQLDRFYEKWEGKFPVQRGIVLDETAQSCIKNVVKQLSEQIRINVGVKNSKKYKMAIRMSSLFHRVV